MVHSSGLCHIGWIEKTRWVLLNMAKGKGITIEFHGAAGTVTGSCYGIRHPHGYFLVDCGSFQGNKTIRELNYGKLPFRADQVDCLFLTHAHIDHSGLIPKLCLQGFDGPAYCTQASRDLLSFMLPDSGYIQETEVRLLNQRNARRGHPPVQPIYTKEQAENILGQLKPVGYGAWLDAGKGVRARYWNAGHILGSASIEIEVQDQEGETIRFLFSGDLGPDEKSFHHDPQAPEDVDYLFVEGTYGNREREDISVAERRQRLCEEIREGLKAGGNIIIPAFAVERTQELLHDIGLLIRQGELPEIPVFLDSPLAIKATDCFEKYRDQLPEAESTGALFEWPSLRRTQTTDESKALARVTSGAIIMAASGMCDAGRIRHHLKNNLWRPGATVLLVGYQAQGTLGDLLRRGARRVRIQGEEVEVRARIRRMDDYSAHADQQELIRWVQARQPISGSIFLTHGERAALLTFKECLMASGLDCPVHVPLLREKVHLGLDQGLKSEPSPEAPSPEAISNLDWHNDYAAFLLDLPERLQSLPDSEARKKLLGRLSDILGDAKAEHKWSDQ